MNKPRETNGHKKLMRYLEELIRNKKFIRDLKRLQRFENKNKTPLMYEDWTPEQKESDAEFAQEVQVLLDEYERLRKRAIKLTKSREFGLRMKMANTYGLDINLLATAKALREKRFKLTELIEFETDICTIEPLYEQISPSNKGEEIIYLAPHKQIHYSVYPIALAIHSLASKRDVLDYIEKRWPWIEESLRIVKEKALKNKPRKYNYELIDFIWNNRNLPAKDIKRMIDKEFVGNGLVYYEIQELIRQEKNRRTRDIT